MLRKVHLTKKKYKTQNQKTKQKEKKVLRHALRGHGFDQKQSLNSFLFVFK